MMTTIDLTKEVCTTETPPRPVSILFDKDGQPDGCRIAGDLCDLSHIGTSVNATRGFFTTTLRNVAPPKPEPVLREAWVNFYEGGGACIWSTAEDAEENRHLDCVETRHERWMSDGSPVPGEECDDCTQLIAERDAWVETARQYARNEEYYSGLIDTVSPMLGKVMYTQDDGDVVPEPLRACLPKAVAQLVADLAALKAELARIRPVYDAAVAYARADATATAHATFVALHEAVRAAESATSESHDVFVDAMIDIGKQSREPVKTCKTCRHGCNGMAVLRNETCRQCTHYVYYITNAKNMWEAKSHD